MQIGVKFGDYVGPKVDEILLKFRLENPFFHLPSFEDLENKFAEKFPPPSSVNLSNPVYFNNVQTGA